MLAVMSRRAFHSMTAHEGRLWVFAGGYKDSTSVMAFSNDVHAFNTATWEWERVRVFGAPPLAMWSHAAALLGSRLLVQGGCTLTEWFSDTYGERLRVLMINAAVPARSSQFASLGRTDVGPALCSAVSGGGSLGAQLLR